MALKKLNAEHYLAIKWLAQPKFGGKTLGEIAQICEVTERTLYNWRQDATFDRELKREMVRFQQGKLPEVLSNIYTVASQTENAAMAKLVLQLNDMLTERHDVTTGTASGDIDYDSLDEEIAGFGKRIGNDEE